MVEHSSEAHNNGAGEDGAPRELIVQYDSISGGRNRHAKIAIAGWIFDGCEAMTCRCVARRDLQQTGPSSLSVPAFHCAWLLPSQTVLELHMREHLSQTRTNLDGGVTGRSLARCLVPVELCPQDFK